MLLNSQMKTSELTELLLTDTNNVLKIIENQRELDDEILYYYPESVSFPKTSFLMDIILNKKIAHLEILLSHGLIFNEKEISLLYLMSGEIGKSNIIVNHLENTNVSTKDLLLNIYTYEKKAGQLFNNNNWSLDDNHFIQNLFLKNYTLLTEREKMEILYNCFSNGNGDSGVFIYTSLNEKDKKTFLKVHKHKDLTSYLDMVFSAFYNRSNDYVESIYHSVSGIIKDEVKRKPESLSEYVNFLTQNLMYIRSQEKKEQINMIVVNLEKTALNESMVIKHDQHLRKRL